MEKGPNQQYVDICNIPFQNGHPITSQLENTGKISVVYQTSEAKSSAPFNLLMHIKQNV